MRTSLRSLTPKLLAASTATLAGLPLLAQDSPYDLEKAGWYVRTGAYIQMGMKLSVNRTGPVAAPTAGIYDNGYVQPDISQGAQGLTWNWGYTDPGQVANGQLQYSRVDNIATVGSLSGFKDPSLFGPEILVGFDFYQFEMLRKDTHFGFELGFRQGRYSGSDQATVGSDVVQQRDAYDLGGITPPLPPYSGSFAVPGPLISLTPQPQAPVASRATSSLATRFASDFYTARFGAWITYPLTPKWDLEASLGFTSIYAQGNATFIQSTTYTNLAIPSTVQSVQTSSGDWLPGGYLQVRGEYRVLPWLGIYAGLEVAYNGAFRINGLGYEAKFDFGANYGGSAGLQFSF